MVEDTMENESLDGDAPPLRHSINDFMYHPVKKDSKITVRCQGKRFRISMLPAFFKDFPTLEKEYRQHLDAIDAHEGTAEDGFFATEPQRVEAEEGTLTLQEYFFPESFGYELRGLDERFVLTPADPSKSGPIRPGLEINELTITLFPTPIFHPSQVQFSFVRPEMGTFNAPSKVLVDGKTTCLFKSVTWGDQDNASREIDIYRRIEEAGLLSKDGIRLRRLHGVVTDGPSDSILGLLLTWVDHPHALLKFQQWVEQISRTVSALHDAGIIWGDATVYNVLIDLNDDAWLDDFGGGFTEGWIQRENVESVTGDLEGLAKISEYVLKERNVSDGAEEPTLEKKGNTPWFVEKSARTGRGLGSKI
ncbi:MAG: hypothetical protein M4579_001645 [Chaenotheca gracillima]|nr:MAG: hypothetical protein M4579_001645 [Chaenotheca gracillima]